MSLIPSSRCIGCITSVIPNMHPKKLAQRFFSQEIMIAFQYSLRL